MLHGILDFIIFYRKLDNKKFKIKKNRDYRGSERIMKTYLISKKELLELTGISYGQLYRWKRKNLIPEEWFIGNQPLLVKKHFSPKRKYWNELKK